MPLAEELLGPAAAAGLGACLDRANGPRGADAVRAAAARLDGLALRERSDLLRDALLVDLPDGYPPVEAVVRTALRDPEFTGWMIWPVTEAVVSRALEAAEPDAFESALALLADLTPRLTAEFAIRRVLVADLDRALAVVEPWVRHPDEHVRRLATEGTRPRLPWAIRVPEILARPQATLRILDALYRDPSEYVRRSVANHVNDISHADPDLAVDVVTRWAAAPDDHTPRLVRHALRTAVKKGHPGALALLGFEPAADVALTGLELAAGRVTVGEELTFTFHLENTGDTPAKLAIDYVIHYQKANGRTAPKVFKLTTRTLEAGERLSISRRHSFKRISTRVLHPGSHLLELQINGVAQGKAGFDLVAPV
ncbi:DNA alkylation repair protein [Streptomyces sp. NPDC002574]|uniref:DNA alkylation repair protein n=1 Tax=Streptomyces sp. NPDC002574 TaxID=3364652 RepID=UPI0036C85E67